MSAKLRYVFIKREGEKDSPSHDLNMLLFCHRKESEGQTAVTDPPSGLQSLTTGSRPSSSGTFSCDAREVSEGTRGTDRETEGRGNEAEARAAQPQDDDDELPDRETSIWSTITSDPMDNKQFMVCRTGFAATDRPFGPSHRQTAQKMRRREKRSRGRDDEGQEREERERVTIVLVVEREIGIQIPFPASSPFCLLASSTFSSSSSSLSVCLCVWTGRERRG